jgi:hypothetical protein
LATLVLAHGVARAEPRPARARLALTVDETSAGCVDAPALEAAVEQRLGRDAFTRAPRRDLEVRLNVSHRGRTTRADLVVESSQGTRVGERVLEARADDCATLRDSLALVLALLVDLEIDEPSSSAPADATPELRERRTPVRIPPAPVRTERAPLRFESGVAVGTTIGPLPTPAFGALLTGGLEGRGLPRVRLRLGGWLPEEQHVEDAAGARFTRLTAGLALCPSFAERGRLQGFACASQTVTSTHGRGFGYDANRDRSQVGVELGAELRGALRVTRALRLELGTGLAAPLERDRYVYRDRDGGVVGLFRPAPVAWTTDLGFGVIFPASHQRTARGDLPRK